MLPFDLGPQLHHPRHVRLVPGQPVERATADERRRCSAPECQTVLSRYNPSDTCSRHEGWQDTRERHHA